MKTLGLDIGTTTISAVVLDSDHGVLSSVTEANDSFLTGAPYARMQNPARILEIAQSTVHKLYQQHPDVAAVGVTGQMHGILYLDAQGQPCSPLYTWQDGRGQELRPDGRTWVQWMSEVTGYPLATGFGMVTHAYNIHHGLVPPDAAVFCTIPDYLAMVLSGRTAPAIDASNAASLGVYNCREATFDTVALQQAGIDVALLPVLATEPILGVGPMGIPVAVSLGDNQASFLGATNGATDALLVNVGTGGQVSVYTPEYLETDALETRPFPDGGWLLVGASLAGGRSYALLEQFFRQVVTMVQGESGSVYDAMTRALDASDPVEHIPHVTTTFMGTRKDPTCRAAISGLGVDNFTPLHLIHGIMYGMAQELYTMYDSYLAVCGTSPKRMIGSGNGLQKNAHLCRVFEETFGCPLQLSTNPEEAASGAAFYAARHC